MGQYSSSPYYGKYNTRGCYVMGIGDLTDTTYAETDHDEMEKGRKSQSHRLKEVGAGEEAAERMGDATHVLLLWKGTLLHCFHGATWIPAC